MSQTSRIHRYADSNVFVVGGRGEVFLRDGGFKLSSLTKYKAGHERRIYHVSFPYHRSNWFDQYKAREELHICCEKHVGIEWPNFQKAITRRYFRNIKITLFYAF